MEPGGGLPPGVSAPASAPPSGSSAASAAAAGGGGAPTLELSAAAAASSQPEPAAPKTKSPLAMLGKIPKKAGSPKRESFSPTGGGAAAAKPVSDKPASDKPASKPAKSDGPKKKPGPKPGSAGAKKKSGPKAGAKKKPGAKAGAKKKPGPKPGSKKAPKKTDKPAKKKQKTSAAASAAAAGPSSAGYSHYVAEYGNTLKQVDANTLETGGGQAHVLAEMWGKLAPEMRAEYEKRGLSSRIEKIARVNFMKGASPRVQKENGDTAGDAQQVLDGIWDKMPASEREPFLAAARREEHGQAAFKVFSEQYQPTMDEMPLGAIDAGGGEEHVLRAMWEKLEPGKQDHFITEAMTRAEKAAVDAAKLPIKKKRKPRTPGSKSKPLPLSKQYINAACEACAALKERNGSTVQGITAWIKSEKPELDSEEMVKKAVKSGARLKKLEKTGVRYKVTKEWRKAQQEGAKKEREAERAEEKKLKEAERKKLAEQQKLEREKIQKEQAALKEARKKLEAAERERKAALKLNKYPVDDLQALSEVALCDPENMMFYPVAEAHRKEVKELDDKRNQMETKDANRDKYSEGTRVKMLLADADGEEEWFLGNVVAVLDTGLDIAFDDGDFQQDVDFNDEDLYLVVKEQSETEETSHLIDFPPTLSDNDLPPHLRAELIGVSSMLARFHEDVTLPMFSGEEIVEIVCDDAGLEDGISDEEMERASKALRIKRSELHVQLLHVIGTEDMYSEDFMHVEMHNGMIDAYSWQEVLHRYVLSVLMDNDLEVNRPVKQAAEALKSKGYGGISVEERVCLLCFLCAEALEGPAIRDVIAEDNEAYDKLVKDFEDTEKTRKEQIREKIKKEKQEEREKLSEERSKKNDEKMIAKQEREAKQAADRAEFNEYLKLKNKPAMDDPKDPNWKKEWNNWKSWRTQEKKRSENEAKAAERKAEAERIKAEKKAAKEAEKQRKAEAKVAAKEAKEAEKVAAKLAKKTGGKVMGLDITAAPDPTLASMHGMSRGEYMKHMRLEREKAMEAEKQKRELAELEKQEAIRKAKEAEKEKIERKKRGLAKFEKMREQGLGKQTKEEVMREKEEQRLARKQEALDTKLEQHACSLTPFGRDRFLNRYWWTPAYPGRLYVEKMKMPAEFMPPLAQAIHSAGADGSEEERRAAAAKAMEERLRSLSPDLVRKQLEALGLTPEDTADVCQLATEQLTQDLKGKEPTLVEFANMGKVVMPPSRQTRVRKKKTETAAGDADPANPEDQTEAAANADDADEADEDLASPKEAPEELNDDDDDDGDDAIDEDDEVDTDYWGIDRTEEEWGYYDTPEQLDALLDTINPLGKREKKLQANINRYSDRIRESMATKQGRRGKRGGGGGGSKKFVEPVAMLVNEMRSLVADYIPKTEAIRDNSEWDQQLNIAEQYMDVIEPLKELGEVLCRIGATDEKKLADKQALIGRQWTEEEDEELSNLCIEEGPDDWEEKKQKLGSMRSATAIKMRWENTLQKRVEEELAAKQAAGAAFAIDQVVWAKVQYYPWWPARISKNPRTGECLLTNGKYHVTFFDDDTRGSCEPQEMQNFEGEMEAQLKLTVKKNLQAKRVNSIKAAKAFFKSHPDAQMGKGEIVTKKKSKTPSAAAAAAAGGTSDDKSKDKSEDKDEDEEDDHDGDEEMDVDDAPKNWTEWTAKWTDALERYPTETAMIFSLYALRDRTSELITPLKTAAAGGKKGKKKPGKSPSGKGRRRAGRVNYNEDDDDEDEEEEVDDFSVEDLIEAAEMGDRPRLRKILDAGVSADAATDEGATPLMLAAQEKQKACLKLLLQRGAKVDKVDADGWSALMFAAKADDNEAIRMLCDSNADTEIKDKAYGMTAFLLACENGCPDAVQTLAECGANIKAKDGDGSDGKKLAEAEDPPHEDVLEALKDLKQGSKQPAVESKKRGRASNNSAAAEPEDVQPPRAKRGKGQARKMLLGAVTGGDSSRGRSRGSQKRKAAEQEVEQEDEDEGDSEEEEEEEDEEDGSEEEEEEEEDEDDDDEEEEDEDGEDDDDDEEDEEGSDEDEDEDEEGSEEEEEEEEEDDGRRKSSRGRR